MSLEARTSFQRATNPITDRYGLASSIRSGVLGGGHNLGEHLIVHQALTAVKHTLPVAPFDRRAIARSGIENQLKHSISAISKKS